MNTSKTGLDLIKYFEGYRDTAYLCPASVWTIGHGSTQWGEGRPVKEGDTITPEDAEALLEQDVRHFENCIRKLVRMPLNQNQFDALVSFTYNLGCGALERSTLLKKINFNPNDPDIRFQFLRWNKAAGVVLDGLTRRRIAEANLYFTPWE